MQALLVHVIEALSTIIPRGVELKRAFEEGTEEDCLFIKRLALLLGKCLCLSCCLTVLFDCPLGWSC